MRFRQTPARPGLSLLEVLIAIFVMAVGTVSILVLFPLGLLNVKWALDNEQVARAAANGQALTEVGHTKIDNSGVYPIVDVGMQTLRIDEAFRPQRTNINNPWWRLQLPNLPAQVNGRINRDWFLLFTQNPLTTTSTWTFATVIDPVTLNTANGVLTPAVAPGHNVRMALPSVFVDPAVASNTNLNGYFTPSGAGLPAAMLQPFGVPFHVGATASTRLPFANHILAAPGLGANRPSLGQSRFATSHYRADPFRTDADPAGVAMANEVSMADEVAFDRIGRPELDAAKRFPASRRFSWAYLCRWPDFANPDVCDVTMVCFNGRPLQTSAFTGNPPGEDTYLSSAAASGAALHDTAGFGRMFIKGSTTAVIEVTDPPATPTGSPTAKPANLKPGDWILDNTFILPEFDPTFPLEVAPFLDQYSPATVYTFPAPGSGASRRPGLCGGHFYKVVDVSALRLAGGRSFQVLTLDRPARSDGFVGTVFAGATDVIEKGIGRMPGQ